ncbi:MAG: hypothetical protein KF708_16410 [Pirellulales bacterium]|nr:hypothetical protein [Pirellulales bacterium]
MFSMARVISFLVGVAVCAACARGIADDPQEDLDEILRAYGRAYAELDNYSYKYTALGKPLVSLTDLERASKVHMPMFRGEVTAALDRLRRVRFRAADEFDTGVNLWAFDGERFTRRESTRLTTGGVTRTAVRISDASENDPNYFNNEPLDFVLLAFDLPSAPVAHEDRRAYRLRTLLEKYEFRSEGQAECDGHSCVLLSSDRVRLWLDPKLGFAVRKREGYSKGKKVFEVRASGHRQVVPGVWVPMRVVTITFGSSFDPPEFWEQPLYEREYKITEFRHNIPLAEAMFRIEPEPGEWVNDKTRALTDSAGRPLEGRTVGYVQPADQAQLDEVIARASRARPGAARIAKSPLNFLLVANAIAVLLLGIVLVARWWLRRRPSW